MSGVQMRANEKVGASEYERGGKEKAQLDKGYVLCARVLPSVAIIHDHFTLFFQQIFFFVFRLRLCVIVLLIWVLHNTNQQNLPILFRPLILVLVNNSM